MGLSSKRSRKDRGEVMDLEDFDGSEDDELMVNGEEEEEEETDEEEDDEEKELEGDTDDDEEEELEDNDDDDDDNEDEVEDDNEGKEERDNDGEMEELEKEYKDLHNQEQLAAAPSRGLMGPGRPLIINVDMGLKALLENNLSIAQSVDGGNTSQSSKKLSGDSKNLDMEDDEEWLRISQMNKRIAAFRDKAVDKWQRKTEVTTGAAAIKSKSQAFNQNISEQVAAYMRDPSRMIKQMQQRRSTTGIFWAVTEGSNNANGQEVHPEGDPELLDDSEFYQQLLKEFFETVDPTSSETAFYALKRLQTKNRKIVDRRASKSRKIRYHVHEKIVNFMAPELMNLPSMAPKLFENLFGLKTQKPTAEEQWKSSTPASKQRERSEVDDVEGGHSGKRRIKCGKRRNKDKNKSRYERDDEEPDMMDDQEELKDEDANMNYRESTTQMNDQDDDNEKNAQDLFAAAN
ncbi:hypothetical protein REPUB_Repub04eG0058700 [Reevesia pubescens]